MKILIWDTGLAVEHSNRLKRDGNDVKHFTFWSSEGFPKYKSYVVGKGIVEKVLYFFEELKDADIVMFPDIGVGDLVDYLRKQGKTVFGAGMGEILETRRYISKKIMGEYGILYPETTVAVGVSDLRKKLQGMENVFVKFDIFRGSAETFFVKNYDMVRLRLDNLELDFGPFAEDITFLIEKKMEGPEAGFDLFFNGKDFLKPYMYGYEVKGTGSYISVWKEEMPEPLKDVAEKIKPFLQEVDYRGAISTEGIVVDGKMYLIDWCCRFFYPGSALYTEVIENYSEVISAVARGENVRIQNKTKYSGAVALESEFAKENWLAMVWDEKYNNKIKVRTAVQRDGIYYAVPGFTSVLVVIGWGDSVEEVKQDIRNTVENANIVADMISKETGGLDIVEKVIEEGIEKEGIDF